MKRIVFLVVGCIGLGLGAVGAVLPLLPAFPFLLLAAVCFAKSSKRLNNWLVGTKMYKENVKPFLKGQGMTPQSKLKVIILVTVLMSIGFFMLREIPVGQIILAGVWVFHLILFAFIIKTRKAEEPVMSEKDERAVSLNSKGKANADLERTTHGLSCPIKNSTLDETGDIMHS